VPSRRRAAGKRTPLEVRRGVSPRIGQGHSPTGAVGSRHPEGHVDTAEQAGVGPASSPISAGRCSTSRTTRDHWPRRSDCTSAGSPNSW
jgi:hypothetical protein